MKIEYIRSSLSASTAVSHDIAKLDSQGWELSE